jgi:hypothetical protein
MESQIENGMYDIDREAEAHGYATAQPSFDLVVTKESIIPSMESQINTLIQGVESGVISGLEVFAVFRKLEGLFQDAKKRIDMLAQDEAEQYPDKTFKVGGIEFTKKEGNKRLQFLEDAVCADLAEKLKQRQDLVKLATNSKDMIFDSEGCEVPKVSIKFDKSSLTVKYK